MFKKILVALALVTVSSFAAWDMFPVQEQGLGEHLPLRDPSHPLKG